MMNDKINILFIEDHKADFEPVLNELEKVNLNFNSIFRVNLKNISLVILF